MHFHCIPGFSMPWFATRHNTKGDGPASSHLHKWLTMRNGSSVILHNLGRSKKSLCLPGCELLSMFSIQQINRQHILIKYMPQNHSKYLLGDKKQQRKFRSRSSQSSPHKSVRVRVMGSEKENIRWFLMVHVDSLKVMSRNLSLEPGPWTVSRQFPFQKLSNFSGYSLLDHFAICRQHRLPTSALRVRILALQSP